MRENEKRIISCIEVDFNIDIMSAHFVDNIICSLVAVAIVGGEHCDYEYY